MEHPGARICSCTDYACPQHPTNHDRGCTPCVAKNQAQGEIPSCFFKLAAPGIKPDSYYFQDFADVVISASAPDINAADPEQT